MFKRLLKTAAWAAGISLFLVFLYTIFMEWTRFRPPDVRITSNPVIHVVDEKTLLSVAGPERKNEGLSDSWLALRGKLWEMHLSGEPIELGMAQSLLGSFSGKSWQKKIFMKQPLITQKGRFPSFPTIQRPISLPAVSFLSVVRVMRQKTTLTVTFTPSHPIHQRPSLSGNCLGRTDKWEES